MSGTETVDLLSIREPLQSYMLCGELAYSFLPIQSQLRDVWS